MTKSRPGAWDRPALTRIGQRVSALLGFSFLAWFLSPAVAGFSRPPLVIFFSKMFVFFVGFVQRVRHRPFFLVHLAFLFNDKQAVVYYAACTIKTLNVCPAEPPSRRRHRHLRPHDREA